MDGAIYHNNPVKIANAERSLIWPDQRHKHPDIILSIGAGHLPHQENGEKTTRRTLEPGAREFLKAIFGFGIDHIRNTLSCERVWKEFLSVKEPSPEHSHRYRRLNVPLDAGTWTDDITSIRELAREQINKSEMKKAAKEIAKQLIASSFFCLVSQNTVCIGMSPTPFPFSLVLNAN
jgi:hypothetical protein